jgi:hypothetical protein
MADYAFGSNPPYGLKADAGDSVATAYLGSFASGAQLQQA